MIKSFAHSFPWHDVQFTDANSLLLLLSQPPPVFF